MIEYITQQNYSHCLTLHWHSDIGYDAARRHLRLLHAMVDSQIVGKDYSTVSPYLRSQAIFAFEGTPGINLHVHSAWKFSNPSKFKTFEFLFSSRRGPVWNKLAFSGTHKLDINSTPEAAANYMLKEQHKSSEDIEIIWSDDFLPSR